MKIAKKLSLNLTKIAKNDREEVINEVGDFIKNAILDHVGEGKSPVAGFGEFRKLSKDYKAKKAQEANPIPNMELTGELLDELDFKPLPDGLEIGYLDDASDLSKNKADNHNKFTAKSKKTAVPRRPFIPHKDENFNRFIQDGIKDILNEYASED